MTPATHRSVRIVAIGAALLAPLCLLRRGGSDVPPPRALAVVIRPSPPGEDGDGGDALFADGSPASVAPRRADGPPQLVGIVGPARSPLAMVRIGDGPVRTIGVGEQAGGWRLIAVAPDRVRFARGAEARVSVLPMRADPDQ